MIKIIASTNRNDAVTLQVAKTLQSLLKAELTESPEIIDLADAPEDIIGSALYEKTGKNEAFNVIRTKFNQADKFLFVIPEYNGSFPGILKVVMDGLDYPTAMKGKKAAIVGLGSGAMGGALAQSHFSDILNYLGCSVLGLKPRLPHIHNQFDGTQFINDKTKIVIDEFIKELITF